MSEFLQGMFGARPVEWIAVACGLINVALIIRRSVWNFPFGFAMVTLYFFGSVMEGFYGNYLGAWGFLGFYASALVVNLK